MKRLHILSLIIYTLFPGTGFALSPDAIEGKTLYPTCQVCHNPEAEPPLGPPMWGVQRRYKRSTIDDQDFIKSMVDFVKKPTLESARHDMAVEQMGLMPPLPLPDEVLEKIATYILEEKFPPPCAHWSIAAKRAEEKGDMEHAKKDQRMLDRFCN
jgi:mono/diheme cytochrome c family protein